MKRLLLLLVVVLQGCAGQYFKDAGTPPEPAAFSLENYPHRDLWTGVVFNGQKIGFTRRQIRPAEGGLWEIESEAVMRIQFLGVDKRIRLHAVDSVRPDLTLEAFRYEHEIDGSRLQVQGFATQSALHFTVAATGSREEKNLSLDRPLYASSAITLLPFARGLKVGAAANALVFNGETQSVDLAEQAVLGYERSELFEGPAFKVSTRMLGLETTTWIAADGRPLFELGLQGVIISALEDEARAKKYLVEASLAKADALLGFSLLRAGPIAAPRDAARMDIVLAGMPKDFVLQNDACRRAGERAQCRIERGLFIGGDPQAYLAPTLAAPSTLREISDLAAAIAKGSAGTDDTIQRLLLWMDANIAKEAVDAFSAADVLRARRGECQGHAYLFAAFARSLGIPARVVNGIVYSEPHGGFLYHSWNEVWIAGRGWRAVDATFGQPYADATHVRILEGEGAAELAPLVSLVGRLRVESVRTGKIAGE